MEAINTQEQHLSYFFVVVGERGEKRPVASAVPVKTRAKTFILCLQGDVSPPA